MVKPTTEEATLRAWDRLMLVAQGGGHDLANPEQDTEVSLIAECKGCEELFAADGQEAPHLFSRVLDQPCVVAGGPSKSLARTVTPGLGQSA